MTSHRFLVRVTLTLAAVGILSCQAVTLSAGAYGWGIIRFPPLAVKADIFYGNMDTLLQKQGVLFTASSGSNHDETARLVDTNTALCAR